jgi:hypothetical protein
MKKQALICSNNIYRFLLASLGWSVIGFAVL